MPRLGYVWFWPNGGHVESPWCAGPAADAFARTSRRVTERYSEGLTEAGIETGRASVQMMVGDLVPDGANARVQLHLLARDETVRVDVPPEVAQLGRQDRARLVLDIVDATMLRLAEERGWNVDGLQRARQHTLDHHLEYEMSSTWKTNPSRTRRARPVVRVDDDGFGTLCFEVQDAKSGDPLGFTERAKTPINSFPKFKRSFGKWRWANNHTLERSSDWHARVSTERGVLESTNIDEPQPWPRRLDPVPERSALPVEVTRIQ